MSGSLARLSSSLLLSPADSARAVAQVYTISLVATFPLMVAALAAVALRHSSAGTRALVWRSAVMVLLTIYIGQLFPVRWMVGALPAPLAAPLVALGEMQLTVGGNAEKAYDVLTRPEYVSHSNHVSLVRSILLVYWLGVVGVLVPLGLGWATSHATEKRSAAMLDPVWLARQEWANSSLGVRGKVRVLVSDDVSVPMTWGVFRPVVVLPTAVMAFTDADSRAIMLHELAHVRGSDVLFKVVARVVCALLWFHPGAWWIARQLRRECELACDNRVLAAGTKASDYAELLMRVSEAPLGTRAPRPLAVALANGAGLRERLAEIVDLRRDVRSPSRGRVRMAVLVTLSIVAPMSAVRLTPSRDVLTTLMRGERWESRAYAVIGLAERADSVDVARAASRDDPNPRVRAWARYALARASGSPERATPIGDRYHRTPSPL